MKIWTQNVKMADEEVDARSEVVVLVSAGDSKLYPTSEHPEFGLMWLHGVRNHMTELKRIRGHLFLNEAYDALGLSRSAYGATDGWFDTDVTMGFEFDEGYSAFLVTMTVEHDIHNKI